MGTINFKLNDTTVGVPSFSNNKTYDSISVVPSTLMRTPSFGFSKLHNSILVDGVLSITHSFTADEVTISAIEAVVRSDVGKHFVTLQRELKIPSDTFDAGKINNIYFKVKYNPNDTLSGSYPLDELDIVCQDEATAPPANSTEVLKVTVDGSGNITATTDTNIQTSLTKSGALELDTTDEHTQAEIDTLEQNA